MKYKVLITTSGIGSRLGKITNYTNKCLVRVGAKPVISHIIESYPRDTSFVITLGYFGNQVLDFLKIAYPDRKFEFVKVDKFKGTGSSLLYSLIQAKDKLQIPFIYHACDTIITEDIPDPSKNWIAGYKGKDSTSYASLSTIGISVNDIHRKGHMNYDYLHMGLIGVNNYIDFWKNADLIINNKPKDSTLGDVDVLKKIIPNNYFEIVSFKNWFDIGSIEGLVHAKKKLSTNKFHVLDKLAESIFQIDNHIIKFFNESKIAKNRVSRAKTLGKTVPKIISSKDNFYKYEYVDGELFSNIANRSNFLSLLDWAKNELWKKVNYVSKENFRNLCKKFYYDKTIERINQFYKNKNLSDTENVINDQKIPKLSSLIAKINFDELSNQEPTLFHGDFILDNIIRVSKNKFKLIDWRQDFAGNIDVGDMYYDFAKLSHNLVVNHDIIDKNLFTIDIKNKNIDININRYQKLVDCENVLFDYLAKNDFDVKKVKTLRAIIWLNMAPLHHHPFDLFLFYYGKYELANIMNKN